MSSIEAIALISIITNVVTLVDFSKRAFHRTNDLSGRYRNTPQAFRSLNSILPCLHYILTNARNRIDNAELDEKACKALRPLITDCGTLLTDLKLVFEKILPKDGDTRLQTISKAFYTVHEKRKVEKISDAIDRHIAMLVYAEGRAGHVQGSPSAIVITNQIFDDPYGRAPIRIEILGKNYEVPLETCQSNKGLVTWLMFMLRNCRNITWKRRIESGEFWLVKRHGDNHCQLRRSLRGDPIVLADTWEEEVLHGKTFSVILVDVLKDEERCLVTPPWKQHVAKFLSSIYEITDWHV